MEQCFSVLIPSKQTKRNKAPNIIHRTEHNESGRISLFFLCVRAPFRGVYLDRVCFIDKKKLTEKRSATTPNDNKAKHAPKRKKDEFRIQIHIFDTYLWISICTLGDSAQFYIHLLKLWIKRNATRVGLSVRVLCKQTKLNFVAVNPM